MLMLYMPKGLTLNEITAGHAKQFFDSLSERGLASSTVHKRVGFARQFFQDAVDWELITANPFAGVKTQGQ
jgi:site-specific recombinase XerD